MGEHFHFPACVLVASVASLSQLLGEHALLIPTFVPAFLQEDLGWAAFSILDLPKIEDSFHYRHNNHERERQ